MLKILHVARRESRMSPGSLFAKALREFGEFVIVEDGDDMTDAEALALMREADVLLTGWDARMIPAPLAEDPGRVRYVLNLGGTCRSSVPIEIVRSGIPVTNWGDAPANQIAEGAMALLLAVLKDLRQRTEHTASVRKGTLKEMGLVSGALRGLRLGLYGCGAIGRRFVELVAPFDPEIFVHDPFVAALPKSLKPLDSLEDLFARCEAVVILVGLSDETRGSVTPELLSRLPDHGVVINTARGAVVDQDALFAELKSGRLRAGLDVLIDDDYLDGHEAHSWPNAIITCHDIGKYRWPKRSPRLSEADKVALENLRRFVAGEELRFVMDEKRYLLST